MTLIADHITYLAAQEAMGWPVEEWKGRCYEVACKMVEMKLVQGVPEYGLYLGPVDPGGYFNYNKPAQRHGWIRLPNGDIIDPTLWVFRGFVPFIALIPHDAEKHQAYYDLGGKRFRREVCGDNPPPEHTGKGRQIDNDMMELPDPEYSDVVLLLGEPPWDIFQIFWLGNRLPDELAPATREIYAGLIRANCVAMIPIDFRIKVFGQDHLQVEREIRNEE